MLSVASAQLLAGKKDCSLAAGGCERLEGLELPDGMRGYLEDLLQGCQVAAAVFERYTLSVPGPCSLPALENSNKHAIHIRVRAEVQSSLDEWMCTKRIHRHAHGIFGRRNCISPLKKCVITVYIDKHIGVFGGRIISTYRGLTV